MNKSESIKELTIALCKVQAELQGAVKESANPHFRSRYADLESCWEALRPVLPKHGLAVIQTMARGEKGPIVITTLAHVSGEWISGELELTPSKNDPQGMCSCITYSRRYSIAAITGLTQTDDDGNHASGKEEPTTKVHKPAKQAPVEHPEENPPIQGEDVNQDVDHKRTELLQLLQNKMKEAGLKSIDIMNVARVFKKDEGKTKVSELSLEKIELFIAKWDKIVTEHEKFKKQA